MINLNRLKIRSIQRDRRTKQSALPQGDRGSNLFDLKVCDRWAASSMHLQNGSFLDFCTKKQQRAKHILKQGMTALEWPSGGLLESFGTARSY
jgi:hypothetical protein